MKRNKADEIADVFSKFECANSEDDPILGNVVEFYRNMADHYRRIEVWLENHATDVENGTWGGE